MLLASSDSLVSSPDLIYLVAIAIIGPVLLWYLEGRRRRRDRQIEATEREKDREHEHQLRLAEQQADYKRQDEVAAALRRNNEVVAESTAETRGRLEVIHILVNSTLTAAKESQLEALKGQLALLLELTSYKKEQEGTKPSSASTSQISLLRLAISELDADLQHRLAQTSVAEEQIEQNKEREDGG
jgi:hypothetical protein